MDTADTPNFGLSRVGAGETLSKDGYKPLDADRITLDAILHALELHTHDGTARLADPPDGVEPDVTVSTVGGQLPADTTFYYAVSLLDRWGLETAVSTEAEVTTPSGLTVDGAPGVTAATDGGSLTPGTYTYVYTYVSEAGGETDPSPTGSARVITGTTNSCLVDLPDLPETALYANVYRSRDGQSQFFYAGQHDGTTDVWTDAGETMDYTIVAPRVNTTGSTCSATISVASWDASIWDSAIGWRVYRATAPGAYTGTSLVHEVVETESEESTVLRKTWVDDGDELQPGTPRGVSATISGGVGVDGVSGGTTGSTATPTRGTRCLTISTPVGSGVFDGTSGFPAIYLPHDIQPTALSLSAAGVSGRTGSPVEVVVQSTGGDVTDGPISVTLVDDTGRYVSTWPAVAQMRIQAESGTFSASTVTKVADLSATGGMAVLLDEDEEHIDVTFQDVEPGWWSLQVRHKFSGTLDDTDLRYDFYSGTTQVFGENFFGLTTADQYATVEANAGNPFWWDMGPMTVRIEKQYEPTITHTIDWIQISHVVPTIPAGWLSLAFTPPGSGSVGTQHTYTLWF